MRHIEAIEEQAYLEPEEDVSIDIPGIDVKTAVRLLGGSVEEYINILKVFDGLRNRHGRGSVKQAEQFAMERSHINNVI